MKKSTSDCYVRIYNCIRMAILGIQAKFGMTKEDAEGLDVMSKMGSWIMAVNQFVTNHTLVCQMCQILEPHPSFHL